MLSLKDNAYKEFSNYMRNSFLITWEIAHHERNKKKDKITVILANNYWMFDI